MSAPAPLDKSRQEAKEFLVRLDKLLKNKGANLAIQDISQLLHELTQDGYDTLLDGLRKIAGKIENAKVDIAHVHPDQITGNIIPDASQQLDAVVKHTEEAANRIMDAAEKIQNIVMETGSPKSDEIVAQVTEIFEASNFQDITGQRIRKVIKTFQDIEAIVGALMEGLQGKVTITSLDPDKLTKTGDAALMDGPALEASSQDDIDRLFGS